MQFRAKILTPARTVEDISVDAAGEAEARQLIASSGGRVLELRAGGALPAFRSARKGFDLKVFNQQMHSLLSAGQTVVDAVDLLGRNDRKPGSKAVCEALLRALRQGQQLSDSMAALPSVFPELYVAMVRASETTGSIRASIERYMLYQRQVDEIRGKLTAAATYPVVLLGVGSLVIAFLMLYVLPRFAEVYDDVGTMGASQAGVARWWGAFVQEHTLIAWGAVIATYGAVGATILHPALRAALYIRVMRSPWIGERLRMMQLGRLYRTLSMLVRSGLSVLAAMRMARASLPLGLHDNLDQAVRLISEGRAMSHAMQQCGLSTEIAVRLLEAGESSGNLEEMMGHIADFYDQETARWIDLAGRLIEPVLMLAMGLVVGAIVLMLYSPIFDLANIV
jgi:general secretion pathway protein F